jgi:precorrin-2 dehydrogenase/sirohydrochlorin ferrochelatase
MFLKLAARPCLVVGAGTIAAPKIESLLRAGASVTVIAPLAHPEIQDHALQARLTWHAREFVPSDLTRALAPDSGEGLTRVFLVIAATDLQAVNHAVAEAARAANILCNSVDDPPDCDFFYPSVVRRGDLQIAISTAGKSPALAQRLREEIDALTPPDAGQWLSALGETRLRILATYPPGDPRKQALHMLAARDQCDPADCPVQQSLDRLLPNATTEPRP